MALQRRQFMLLLGAGIGGVAFAGTREKGQPTRGGVPFRPLRTTMPLPSDGLNPAQQRQAYQVVRVRDTLDLPPGYRQSLLASWGEPVGASRFGYNNDYLALLPQGGERALLTVNFEYISALPWRQGFAEVLGRPLPYEAVVAGLKSSGSSWDVWSQPLQGQLAQDVELLTREALTDQGVGVIRLKRSAEGSWERDPGEEDRRISGLAGFDDPAQQLYCTGPAAAVFRLSKRRGYDDGLGDRIIGTFANCAGGTTPWGTVLSGEENFQSQVPEAVHADGSAFPPSARPFHCSERRIHGLGNPLGLAGNKYGWMVEVNPADPSDPGTKHTALGRFRHEAVAVAAQAGQPLVVYSGCDRRGGHLYRFVSDGTITDPKDPANSQLLSSGTLYGAVFLPDGSGSWRALRTDTAVDPLPAPAPLPHSNRELGGAEHLSSEAQRKAYRQRYRTLGDLYVGEGEAQLGALLIDAHLAANAAGITPTARPEDTEIDPFSGDLLVTFTSGLPGSNGTADMAIFKGPQGQTPWNAGWIMRLTPGSGDDFRWQMVATGGKPQEGGLGFANPDNLAVDPGGDLWMVTDIGTSTQNSDKNGGSFGNNSCWVIPTSGPQAGEALCFATGPVECELTGLALTPSGDNLFLAVQHPGERHGTRSAAAAEARTFNLELSNGEPLKQLRWVPLGSNWPSSKAGAVPRPGVVVISRSDQKPLLAPLN